MDRERLEAAIGELLRAIGEDPTRPDLVRTPERVAELYTELFSGLHIDPRDYLADALPETHRELVVIRDITVHSMCEHHLVPMVGLAHVAYLPNGRIAGFDRLVKVIDGYARRPQIQERLTGQIADAIAEMLQPDGVAVRLELEHMCMTIRGVRRPGSRVITNAYRGRFDEDPSWRAEFRAALD